LGWELQLSSKQDLNKGFSGREQLRLKDQNRWRQGAILLPPIFLQWRDACSEAGQAAGAHWDSCCTGFGQRLSAFGTTADRMRDKGEARRDRLFRGGAEICD
jgi:hypothetical protein